MTTMPSLSASSIDVEAARSGSSSNAIIRLLLLTDTSIASTGGSERFLRNLLRRLPPDRYRVTLVQLGGNDYNEYEAHAIPDGPPLRIIDIPVGRIYASGGWRALVRLRRLARRERFDIIQSHHEKSDLLNALVPWMQPSVRLSNRRDMGFKKSARLRFLFRLLNHRYDCVVAPAMQILSALADREDMPRRGLYWIANGVDTDRFRPLDAGSRSALRESLGLAPGDVAFGCVASFYPVKRHDVLIDAFAAMHRTRPRTKLFLIGQGELKAALVARADMHGLGDSVRFLGTRGDVEELLPALDAVLLTSSTEGMSNALLEAMACGLPVIASAVGGNLHLVHHEVNGLHVPAGDVQATADAMAQLADSEVLRVAMARQSRQRIEREFSLDGMANAYDRLYHRLLGLR